MKLTWHARKMFRRRFPDLDVKAEWLSARRHGPSRKQRQQLRKQCPLHARKLTVNFKGYYYKISRPANVVFVVAPPETVVTVFPLES